MQGIINFVEFNLPNSNLSSNYQLDNIISWLEKSNLNEQLSLSKVKKLLLSFGVNQENIYKAIGVLLKFGILTDKVVRK